MPTCTLLLAVIFLNLTTSLSAQQTDLREIKGEFSIAGSNAVDINMERDMNVEVVPWNGNSLKVVYRYDAGISGNVPVKSLQELGLHLSQSGDRSIVDVNAKASVRDSSLYIVIDGKTYYKLNPGTPVPLVERPGKTDLVFFYIPGNKKLILKLHHNVKVTINGDLPELEISTAGYAGCTLIAKSIGKLDFKCSYPHASFDAVDQGTIHITGGQLFIKKAGSLSLQSRYSSVQIGSAEKLNMISSQSDQYTIDELGSLRGLQEHGVFFIGLLKKEIDVSGTGGISISDISAEVESIKIKSNAEVLNLPVKHLKNYAINVNAPAGILLLTEEIRKGIVADSNAGGENPLARFMGPGKVILISNVGDTKGKHTLFDISCPECTVNFRSQE